MTIRVLVLDDSLICRVRLRQILEEEADIVVVGEASNGDGVLELIDKTRPEVLVVDLQMPGIAGHETIERVMASCPRPILVVTGQPQGVNKTSVFEAIRRGALELAEKPTGGDVEAERNLRTTVRQLSKVPVVRHMAGRLNAKPLGSLKLKPSTLPPPPGARVPVVAIGGSAGGPLALAALLTELPEDFPAAIGVVQHLPVGFTNAFQEFLQSRVKLKVKVVQGQTPIEPGTICIAKDDRHLAISRSQHFITTEEPPLEGHRPAVDVLLNSVARRVGPAACGVVMSGIGKDGADGLMEMRKAGALTIAQSSESCAVYGMPRAALSSGAASLAMAPKEIAEKLLEWVDGVLQRAAV